MKDSLTQAVEAVFNSWRQLPTWETRWLWNSFRIILEFLKNSATSLIRFHLKVDKYPEKYHLRSNFSIKYQVFLNWLTWIIFYRKMFRSCHILLHFIYDFLWVFWLLLSEFCQKQMPEKFFPVGILTVILLKKFAGFVFWVSQFY